MFCYPVWQGRPRMNGTHNTRTLKKGIMGSMVDMNEGESEKGERREGLLDRRWREGRPPHQKALSNDVKMTSRV